MEEQKNNQTAVEVKTEDETQYDEIQKVKQVERTDSYFDGKVLARLQNSSFYNNCCNIWNCQRMGRKITYCVYYRPYSIQWKKT